MLEYLTEKTSLRRYYRTLPQPPLDELHIPLPPEEPKPEKILPCSGEEKARLELQCQLILGQPALSESDFLLFAYHLIRLQGGQRNFVTYVSNGRLVGSYDIYDISLPIMKGEGYNPGFQISRLYHNKPEGINAAQVVVAENRFFRRNFYDAEKKPTLKETVLWGRDIWRTDKPHVLREICVPYRYSVPTAESLVTGENIFLLQKANDLSVYFTTPERLQSICQRAFQTYQHQPVTA